MNNNLYQLRNPRIVAIASSSFPLKFFIARTANLLGKGKYELWNDTPHHQPLNDRDSLPLERLSKPLFLSGSQGLETRRRLSYFSPIVHPGILDDHIPFLDKGSSLSKCGLMTLTSNDIALTFSRIRFYRCTSASFGPCSLSSTVARCQRYDR